MNKITIISLAFASILILSIDAKSRKESGKSILDTSKLLAKTSTEKQPLDPIAVVKNPLIENAEKELNEVIAESLVPIPAMAAPAEQKISAKNNKKPLIEKKVENDIYLNFDNAELTSLINYLADLKKINILPDRGMAGIKVSLSIRKPISKDEAWNLLQTITDMSGFSIVKTGIVYKIVPNAQKLVQPLPTFINVPLEKLPSSDVTIRYVALLNNIRVGEVKGLLDSMLSTPHLTIPQENVNGIVISDKSNNIKSAMRIINELDKTGMQESVVVIRLKERNASDVEIILKNLIENKQPTHPLAHLFVRPNQSNSFFGPTKIFAEERTNSIILLGTRDATLTIENFIKEYIDTTLKSISSPLHVYELQYADAKQITEILREATANPESLAGQEAAKYGAVRSGVKYFKNMTLKADEEGNRIVVSTADKQDWKLLKETIRNLDKPQPQVAIESLIVVVDANDAKQLAGQVRNKKHNLLGAGIDFQSVPINQTVIQQSSTVPPQNLSLLGNLVNGLLGGLGETLFTFGRQNNIWGIFQILQTYTRSSIVAQPFLTVTNKFSAEALIGETQRRNSETAFTNSGPQVQGFDDIAANLVLKVVPQINIDGVINLKITLDLNQFVQGNVNDILTRKVDTAVSIANGQVLALGGFVQTQVTEVESKTPILGDIPFIGALFKNKSKSITKNNILVFLCPTIIKPRSSPGIDLYTRMKLQRSRREVGFVSETGMLKDPIQNWFFNPDNKSYAYKIDDYASARYQPVTVDIKNDEYYRAKNGGESVLEQHQKLIKHAEDVGAISTKGES